MTSQASDRSSQERLTAWFREFLVWLPLLVGVVHQFLMATAGIDRIYVFVDPPKYIRPWVSLEYQWWIVLVFVTAAVYILVSLGRLRNVPYRVVYPSYAYLVFLLIFVKPV